MSSRIKHARHLIQAFRDSSPGLKVWHHVEREPLADGMDALLDDPDSLAQGHYGTCGPTAIVRDIICDHPDEFVSLTVSLYRTGHCKVHNGRHTWRAPLHASYDLRSFNPGPSVNPAGWMLTATLRDKLNDTFCREHFKAKKAVCGTTFEQQGELFHDMGYRRVHIDGDFLYAADVETMNRANHYFGKNYHVVIGINATIIRDDQQDTPPSSHHNHWVELLTQITFDPDETVSFEVFSWGDEHPNGIPVPIDPARKLNLSVFQEKFFGFVAAKY
jgi:hypothetical protein